MGKLLGREAALVVLTGLFAAYVYPAMLGSKADPALFSVGLMMAFGFASLYAMVLLALKRAPLWFRAFFGLCAELALCFPGYVTAATQFPDMTYANTLAAGAGGLVVALAGLARDRWRGAISSLAPYALSMAGLRWLLIPLMGDLPGARFLAWFAGGAYFFLRTLAGVLAPVESGPLVRRAVPDAVVGLVEATSRRRARPYATAEGGATDEGAISILCPPVEAGEMAERLRHALALHPVLVVLGPEEGGMKQVIIRQVPS